MSVVNGQPNSAEVLNPAFMSRTVDTSTTGTVTLNNSSDVNSGATVSNTQQAINETFDAVGMTGEGDATRNNYSSNQIVSDGDNRKEAIEKLDAEFHATTGHTHSGNAGEGPKISATDLDDIPLKGYIIRGTDLTSVTGTTYNITSVMTGKSPSSGSTDDGVVVTSPYNLAVLRETEGASPDNPFTDGSDNVVYGRVTESAGTWTLSFYVDIAGTETAYNFTSSSDIRWFYQELFYITSPTAPVYNENLSIQSDNAAETVPVATTGVYGKVKLATTVTDVSSTSSAGTADATVANADHSHKGVYALKIYSQPGTETFGTVELEAGSGITLTKTGQRIKIDSGSVGFQQVLGTGDGVTTIFGPLTNTPSSDESIVVFVDGNYITPTDYTVSTSITFTIAPGAGQKVEVFYLSSGAAVVPMVSGIFRVEHRTITIGEAAAEELSLTYTPAYPGEVTLDIIGGSSQYYGTDYTATAGPDKLIWSGYALDGVLTSGDQVRIMYQT